MTLYECENDMILVDCGLAFPEPDMLGVDLVIPDFTYVEQNIDKIKGIFITHGHEDHIGGLAYLLQRVSIPVYGTKLTIGLIEGKLADGLMKDEEIYTIFDTKKILNKPATVQISKTSGLAGIAYWINQTYGLEGDEKLDKHAELVVALKDWVDTQYEEGRQTAMTDRELEEKIEQLAPGRYARI